MVLTSIVLASNDVAQLDRRLDAIVNASVSTGDPWDPTHGVLSTGRSASTGQVMFQRGFQLPSLPPGTETVTVNGVDYRVRTVTVDRQGGLLVSIGIRADSILLDPARIPLYVAIGVVALLIAAGLGWLLGGVATRPLRRLTEQTRRLGKAGGDQIVPVHGAKEAEDLSEAMVGMLSRLAAAQAATTRSLQAAQDFAANAAHELRTPLTAMRADLDTLRIHALPPEERDEVVADLARAQRRIEATITALGQLASGQLAQDEDRELIDVEELLDRVARDNMRVEAVEVEVRAEMPAWSWGGPADCGWRWTTWCATLSCTAVRRASCWPRTAAAHGWRSSSTTTGADYPPRSTARCSAASRAAVRRRRAARVWAWRWWLSRPRCTAAASSSPTVRWAACA